jgi:hypothetical protein
MKKSIKIIIKVSNKKSQFICIEFDINTKFAEQLYIITRNRLLISLSIKPLNALLG